MKRIYLSILTLLLTGAFFIFPKPTDAVGMPAVVVNELLWMGSSQSSTDEWIELRNTTGSPIDITGWRVTKLSSGAEVPMLTIQSGSIPANGYFLIANDPVETSRLNIAPQLVDASVSLVNSKLQITLSDASGVLIDRADDGSGSPLAGDYQSGAVWKSMERNPSGVDGTQKESWHTASASIGFDDAEKEVGTPGSDNSNQPPVINAAIPADGTVGATINVDASETTDPEGDSVTAQWDFGDGALAQGATATHVYAAAGSYQITVTAGDGRADSVFSSTIAIAQAVVTPPSTNQPIQSGPTTDVVTVGPSPSTTASPALQTSKSIRLNEILPNPKGRDVSGEFIELVNEGTHAVDLRGWKITDRIRTYIFSTSVILGSKHYLMLTAAESRLSFKNSGRNEWFLVDPFGTVMQGVAYEGAPEGRSFSYIGNEWLWASPTPGTMNQADEKENEAESAEAVKHSKELPFTSLKEIRRKALRSDVRIRGTVIAAPGSLSANFFYVVDGSAGLQIFSSKGAFPDLTPGDLVEIRGKVGEANGERKLNIQSVDDLVVVDTADTPDPVPYSETLATGVLTTVEGVLGAKRGTSLTIDHDGRSITVTIPRSIHVDKSDFSIGDQLAVTGLWRVTKDGGRIYLLNTDDLILSGGVLGAEAPSPESEIPVSSSRDAQQISASVPGTKKSALPAILPPLLLFGFLGAYLWRKRKNAMAAQ